MDVITFRFLINLAVLGKLNMHLIDVITTYLYDSIDNDIYMKILKDLNCLKQIVQSLIVYTQSSYNDPCMDYSNLDTWYNRLSKYLLKKGY